MRHKKKITNPSLAIKQSLEHEQKLSLTTLEFCNITETQ